jgi:hypothetical protein
MSSITGGRLYSGICGGSSAAGGGGALLVLDVTSVDADVHSLDELLAGLVSSTSSEHHPSPFSRTERGEGSSQTTLSSFAMMMIVHLNRIFSVSVPPKAVVGKTSVHELHCYYVG